MKNACACIIVTIAGIGLLKAQELPEQSKELQRFNGLWLATKVNQDGQDLPKEDVEKIKLSVTGEQYQLQWGDETFQGKHQLDPTKKPKTIDAVRSKGPNAGKRLRGIYELEEKSYRACFAEPDAERPTDFTARKGRRVLTFRKVDG